MLNMKCRPRIYYTESQKAVMWDRWQKGESLHSIARLFDRSHGAIAGILSRYVAGFVCFDFQSNTNMTTKSAGPEGLNQGAKVTWLKSLSAFSVHDSPCE